MKPYTGPHDETCPHHLGELCSKVCPTCKFQAPFEVPGSTGITWECGLYMHHILTIEQSHGLKHVAAAVETFRNETVQQNTALLGGSMQLAQKLIAAKACT